MSSNQSERFECKRCLMDRTATEIVFTDTGCNFCDVAMKNKPTYTQEDLKKIIAEIKGI